MQFRKIREATKYTVCWYCCDWGSQDVPKWKITAQSLGRQSDFRNSSKAVAVQFWALSIHLLDVISQRLKWSVRGLTWGEVLIDGPVVHLKCSIAPISGEAHYMVLAVIYSGAALLNSYVRCSDVECDSNFALFLKKEEKNMLLFFFHNIYINNKYMAWILNFDFCHWYSPYIFFLYSPKDTWWRDAYYSVLINF